MKRGFVDSQEEGLKELARIDVSEDLFNDILLNNEGLIISVSNEAIKDCFKGTDNKAYTRYDGEEYLITTEAEVHEIYPDFEHKSSWKQIIVRKDLALPEHTLKHTITGTRAYLRFNDILSNYYTKDEIEACLKRCEADYDEDKIQVHYDISLFDTVNESVCFTNCVKYDINGAHNDALCEIFPKAKDAILKLYNERHEHPINKCIVNYYCGMLKRRGYEKTYNWIVQRTTAILRKAMKAVGGTLVYANTDGFMVKDPDRKIMTSTELGQFKLEYQGTAYMIQSDNYILYQTGDKQFGSAMLILRKDIDLSKGEFVTYTREFVKLTDDSGIYRPVNIKKIKGEVIDYENL